MRILHIGLSSHFTEDMSYQDNMLSFCNVKDGNDVMFVSDVFRYNSYGQLVKGNECDNVLRDGLRLVRLKYDYILSELVTNKLRKIKKIVSILENFKPDVILYHGVVGWALLDVADYVKRNPKTLFYIDSHEDFHNTAKNIVSKLFYKYINGYFVKKVIPVVKKVFYVTHECKRFLQDMYKLSEDILEYYPLGGCISTLETQKECRDDLINEFNLPKDVIICMHSGKLEAGKRTEELLNAFQTVNNDKLHLFIFGTIPDNLKNILMPLINKDDRVHFLGWKTGKDIEMLLSAADLYCQPGTQSVTFQTSLCCGCVAMVYPYESHFYLMGDDCFYVKDESDMKNLFRSILKDDRILKNMKERSFEKAKKILDYNVLARRIYE